MAACLTRQLNAALVGGQGDEKQTGDGGSSRQHDDLALGLSLRHHRSHSVMTVQTRAATRSQNHIERAASTTSGGIIGFAIPSAAPMSSAAVLRRDGQRDCREERDRGGEHEERIARRNAGLGRCHQRHHQAPVVQSPR